LSLIAVCGQEFDASEAGVKATVISRGKEIDATRFGVEVCGGGVGTDAEADRAGVGLPIGAEVMFAGID
jgi:hypothetical protein